MCPPVYDALDWESSACVCRSGCGQSATSCEPNSTLPGSWETMPTTQPSLWWRTSCLDITPTWRGTTAAHTLTLFGPSLRHQWKGPNSFSSLVLEAEERRVAVWDHVHLLLQQETCVNRSTALEHRAFFLSFQLPSLHSLHYAFLCWLYSQNIFKSYYYYYLFFDFILWI